MKDLRVTSDTYLKARPVYSSDLLASEKQYLSVGTVLSISSYLEEGDHYKVFLEVAISGIVEWFIPKEHVEITVTENKRLKRIIERYEELQIERINSTNSDAEFAAKQNWDEEVSYEGGSLLGASTMEEDLEDWEIGAAAPAWGL
jgi:hypothetical protein